MCDKVQLTGTCLCGTVKIAVSSEEKNYEACHCTMCRKWGGGPLLALNCETDVELFGEESISVFSSSAWAERGFCAKCGTHLFYRLKEIDQYHIPLGLLDTDAPMNFASQIFIDEKPAHYTFSNDTQTLTGAEVFASLTE